MWHVRRSPTIDGLSDTAVERVERVPLKSGQDGTDQTIDVMAKAAMGKWGAGSPRIRNLAVQIIRDANVDERDKTGEAVAIHNYVMGHLRYVKDPLWYEFVTHPETLAFERADGDCDDHVVLEAALLAAVGIPSRFVVYAFKGAPSWQHVALHAQIAPRVWMPLDPIVKDKPAGWEAPDATNRKVYGVNTPDGHAKTHGTLMEFVGVIAGILALWGLVRQTLTTLEHKS